MRWYVDLLSEGAEPATTLVVEAASWQEALQGACGLQGEALALEQITVELIPDGYRALNTETHASYELRKAPVDAPLSQGAAGAAPGPFADEDTFAPTSSELAEAEEAAAAEGAAVEAAEAAAKGEAAEAAAKSEAAEAAAKVEAARAKGEAARAKGADQAPATPAGGATGLGGKAGGATGLGAAAPGKVPEGGGKAAAAKAPGAPKALGSVSKLKAGAKAPDGLAKGAAPEAAAGALPLPAARPPAGTRTFGSEGAVSADAKLRSSPPALPTSKAAPKPPPLTVVAEAAPSSRDGAAGEGAQILFARGEDPSAQSPLTYREIAFCLPEGTTEAEAERVLRQHLQALVEQIAPAPPGKYIALAAFDVRFEGRPPKPPLVTLTWKDWHGAEPKVAYPAQQQALNASMAGMMMGGGVFPSPFASLPGNVPAPGARMPPPLPGGLGFGQTPYEVLFSRGEDPSTRSPLTYREVALCVPEGTAEPEAEHVLRQHMQHLMAQLGHAPPGKYLALAAFDVRFEGRPPRPPLVTLTWKDWHGVEPKVAYPAQQRLLHGSMAGMSMAGAFPSPFASLPGNAPSPFASMPGTAAAAAPAGGGQILFARGEDPSAQSPLTYREIAFCLPGGTTEAEAERVLRQHLQALVEQIAPAPPGKYIALAAFDVRFEGRPPKPPLVTLTWKDWHGVEPKVAYPAQQQALHGSMAGVSMAGVFPSPFASLPGHMPSPAGPSGGVSAAPSPFNAMPGGGKHTVPLPRADLAGNAAPPAGAGPAPATPSRAGAPRSPRDAKSGGGGSSSSEGWPPAPPGSNLSEASSSDVFASPAVMTARQRPGLEPLNATSLGEDMPTAVVQAWQLPAEAKAEGGDAPMAVFTGEFAIIDEPTPLLGAPALAPEAFRDDFRPMARERPVAPSAPGGAGAEPGPARSNSPAPRSAPPAAPARSAPPAASVPRSAPPAASAPRSSARAASPATRPTPLPNTPASRPPASVAPMSRPPASVAPASAPPTVLVRPPPSGPTPADAEGVRTTLTRAPGAAPRRYASSSDLLGQLFEAMPGLQALETERAGADFVLDLLGRALPSRAAFCHVYDAGRREFVVAGARTPAPAAAGRLIGARTNELDPSLEAVLAASGAIVVADARGEGRYRGGRWGLAGEGVQSLLAAAARSGGRTLGLLELANPADGGAFDEGEGRALEYAAEQFGEFLSRLEATAQGGGR